MYITCILIYRSNKNNQNSKNKNNNNGNVFEKYTRDSVVNISDVPLTPAQQSLLSKGLNFCPTPGEPNFGEIRNDLDNFHAKIRRKVYFATDKEALSRSHPGTSTQGSEVETETDDPFDHKDFKNKTKWSPPGPRALEAFILSNELGLAKSPSRSPNSHNLTREEEKARQELRNNCKIIIKPADKGSAVVIMNREDYIAEGLRQLGDTNFYKEVSDNFTKYHKKLVDLKVMHMLSSKEISQKCATYLTSGGERTSLFYMLPKIHKNKMPPKGRPILSANDCPTERISAFVDHFLRPRVRDIKSYVKDTTHFLNIIKAINNLPEDTLLVTFDVSSLYTNIPNEEGIDACKEVLETHRDTDQIPKNRSLIELLRLVLYKNNFEFNGKHYLQVGGTAMGTRVAPSFANIFMSNFEDKYVYTYRTQPLRWLRYIDDIFCIWPHGKEELELFTNHLNNCHPTIGKWHKGHQLSRHQSEPIQRKTCE